MKYVENGVKDWESAVGWYRKAAELDNKNAMVHIGRAYQYGTGVELNPDIAYEWYKAAGDNEDSRLSIRSMALQNACSAIATQREALSAKDDDPDQASLFAAAVENSFYGQGGAKKYVTNALSLLRLIGDKGLTDIALGAFAMEVGNHYAKNRDDAEAYAAFRLAGDCGQPGALMNLGLLCGRMDPSIIPDALEQSEKYYLEGERMAKTAGVTVHRGSLNYLFAPFPYRSGPFVPVRKANAEDSTAKLSKPIEETTQLAEAGNAEACYELGVYLRNELLEFDRAHSFLTVAAEKGHVKSMMQVGYLLEERDTVADFERAIQWYVKAGDAGDADGYARAVDACGRLKKFNDHERDALKALKQRLWPEVSKAPSYDQDLGDLVMMDRFLKKGADK